MTVPNYRTIFQAPRPAELSWNNLQIRSWSKIGTSLIWNKSRKILSNTCKTVVHPSVKNRFRFLFCYAGFVEICKMLRIRCDSNAVTLRNSFVPNLTSMEIYDTKLPDREHLRVPKCMSVAASTHVHEHRCETSIYIPMISKLKSFLENRQILNKEQQRNVDKQGVLSPNGYLHASLYHPIRTGLCVTSD